MFGLVLDVFIERVDGPQIAQMPVKRGLIFLRCFRNPRHHHVAAIPGITGHNEAPRSTSRLLCGCRLDRQHRERCTSDHKYEAANHGSSGPPNHPHTPTLRTDPPTPPTTATAPPPPPAPPPPTHPPPSATPRPPVIHP